jgi:chromosome segregation ATPase
VAFFSKHSDKEYAALEKKLKLAEGMLVSFEAEKKADSERIVLLEGLQIEQKQENDLLLAQLHQTQEELEKHFLENKSLQERALAIEKQLSDANKLVKSEGDAKVNELQKQKAELEKKLTEANASVAQLKADLEARTASEADLKSENDLLLAQLHQVQEELESYYLKNKDLEALSADVAAQLKRTRYATVNYFARARGFVLPRPQEPRSTKSSSKKGVSRAKGA